MRYWAAPGQGVCGKLSWTEGKPQRVLCSPLERNGSLHFGPHGALRKKKEDVTGKEEDVKQEEIKFDRLTDPF